MEWMSSRPTGHPEEVGTVGLDRQRLDGRTREVLAAGGQVTKGL